MVTLSTVWRMPRPATPLTRPRSVARGFTLLEVIITLVAIGLLAAVGVPTYQRAVDASRLARDLEQMAVLGRAAAANAAADNVRVPATEHFAEALAEAQYRAAAPGTAAAPSLSENFALYTQAEWETLAAYPNHGPRRIAVTLTVDAGSVRTAGLAMLSAGDRGSCVMVTVVGTTLVDAHSARVADPLRCDGALAAAGAPTAPGPGGPGGPGGPAPELRLLSFHVATTSGAFDDFEVTGGGETLAADDFSGSDGVLLASDTAEWFDVGVGLPIVTAGELTGVRDGGNPLVAALDLPNAAWTASAVVTKVPGSGWMGMSVASRADGMATHMVRVEPGGGLFFGGRPATCGPNGVLLNSVGVTVSAGDRVTLDRASDDVVSLVVNGTTVSTVDRTVLDPSLCADSP